jgi:TrmH family RNA methyltransferase
LDSVQDPGNLGTIIRVADWYGIENIVCGEGTVDAFSPKTVQATMGALSRVKVHYTNLKEYIIACRGKNIPVYGTFLDGDDMYEIPLSSNGVIVMGNEGNGISRELDELISDRLYIPSFPADRETSESLNVAMATGIVCAEFRRRLLSLK